jgi:hypothetical protein
VIPSSGVGPELLLSEIFGKAEAEICSYDGPSSIPIAHLPSTSFVFAAHRALHSHKKLWVRMRLSLKESWPRANLKS